MERLRPTSYAMSELRHVVVATDENFAMPTAVTVRSLSVHNLDHPIAVTVLHNGLSASAIDGIEGAVESEQHAVRWHDVSDFDPGATRASHLPDSTYFRLQMGDALDAGVDRVLYLDVDVLVRKDLSSLWSLDLGGAPIGAVRSVHFPSIGSTGAVRYWPALSVDPRASYFNAGVLLVDLPRWRSDGIAERAREHLRSPHLGRGADQEALNVTVSGHWKQLAPTWNYQTPMIDERHGACLLFDETELRDARTDPAIVHFQTRPKPWHRGCQHPWRQEWLEVARETRFERVVDLRERSVADEVRWRTKRAMSALVKGR